MILLRGEKKSTIIDLSDKELDAMFGSFVADIQMSKALIGLNDKLFEANVNIPKGETVSGLKKSIKEKIKIIEPIIKEFNNKIKNAKS